MKKGHFVYILDGARTPIGSVFKSLKEYSAAKLAAFAVKELLARNKIKVQSVDELILGNVVSAGTGQNIARQSSLLAGLTNKTVSYVINNVCGSSLQAVIAGARAIKSQEAALVIAGGTESASNCPYLINRKDVVNLTEANPQDSLAIDGLLCRMTNKRMGDIVEDLVEKYNISRKEQDEFAFNSHKKACRAQEQNFFVKEIIPIKKQSGEIVLCDDKPRKNIDLDKFAMLSAAFRENGTLTAGNSSAVADAASVVILASEKFVREHKKIARARILGYTSVFIDPDNAFESALKAIKEVLKKSSLSLTDIDLFEVCEAFSAQAILIKRKLKIPENKFNIYGGDIALGHPLGATGARILVTLLNAMETNKLKRGLACVSFGGGGAVAVVIEML